MLGVWESKGPGNESWKVGAQVCGQPETPSPRLRRGNRAEGKGGGDPGREPENLAAPRRVGGAGGGGQAWGTDPGAQSGLSPPGPWTALPPPPGE